MGTVIWSPPALDNLDAIAGYIARDSGARASLLAARLIEATDRLVRFPRSGQAIPEIGDPSCRETPVGVYRIHVSA